MSSIRKRLINTVEGCVDDSLAGLVAVNPGLCLLKGHRRVVIRADIEEVLAAGKVAILTGGGSGHEPGRAGFVGPGMATVVVAGPIFTSPPPGDILAALRAVGRRNKAGVLVTFNNYTGDRLTFGQAIERAKSEGIKLDVYINADDCAFETANKTAGRRGLVGGILVIKIAGAMSEDGKSLSEIIEVLKFVSKNMGLHGEAGVKMIKIMTARDTVEKMLDHMTNSANKIHLGIKAGNQVACLLNNLGSLTFLEMNILAKEIIDYLERHGIVVERFYSGHYSTSQEMSGVSITILQLNNAVRNALDRNTTAPAWKFPCLPRDQLTRSTPAHLDMTVGEHESGATGEDKAIEVPIELGQLIYKSLRRCCEMLMSAESRLNQLDTRCGDGDCGHTFKTGATAILQQLGNECNPCLPVQCPYRLGNSLASIIEQAMGGSSGGLYSLFLTAASGALKSSVTSDAWCKSLQYGTEAVMRHGGAAPGYRTMLDALCPAVETFSLALKTLSDTEAFGKAVQAAEEGAWLTAGMNAQAGRASYVNASNLSDPDPGAIAVGIWMRAILEVLTDTKTPQ